MTSKFKWIGSLLLVAAMLLAGPAAIAQTSDPAPAPSTEPAVTPETEAKPAAPSETKPEETRAALVNGTAITREQVETEVTAMGQQMAQRGQPIPPEKLNEMRKRALDSMIDRELLYQETVKTNLTADEAQVEERYQALKQRFGDDAKYQESITAMGLTDKGIREMISRSLVIETFIQTKVTADVHVNEEDKRAFYDNNPNLFQKPEQVEASHILIKTEKDADDAAQQEALKAIQAVQEKVKAGEDFAELAKTHSQGPSAPRGGELGFFGKGQMVKPFEEAAFAMQPGDVSDIVQTQFGYHLIKVTGRSEASVEAYENVAEKIGGYLNQQKSKQAFDAYMQDLKKKSEIEKFI